MQKNRRLWRRYQIGYEVWIETHAVPGFEAEVLFEGADPEEATELAEEINALPASLVTLKIAYTPTGEYIGKPLSAYRLCKTYGIAPECILGHTVCSIGFSAKSSKWYGWSHRALYGFQIGDVVKKGDCCASSGWTDEYLAEHPEANTALPVGFKAKSLDDAKRMAIAFAESVG